MRLLQNILANKWVKVLQVVIIAIIIFRVSAKLEIEALSDDQYFLTVLSNTNILDFLIYRYNAWSGRLFIEAIIASTIQYSIFWKVVIPLTLLMLSCLLAKIANEKLTISGCFFAVILLILVPKKIQADAVLWITGFYNYLLPAAAMFYSFSVILQKSPKRYQILLAVLFTFLFSYQEQTAIAFLVCVTAVAIIHPERRNIFTFIMLALCGTNFLILLAAPGNYVRFNIEIWSWLPEYIDYGFFNKLALAYDRVHHVFVLKRNFPLVFLILALMYLSWRYGYKAISVTISILVSFFYILLSLISFKTNLLEGAFFDETFISSSKWNLISNYLSYFLIMIIILSVLTMIYSLHHHVKNWKMIEILFLTGLLTVFMMGFSPTVFASHFRVDYIFEVMSILCLMCIISPFVNKKIETHASKESL